MKKILGAVMAVVMLAGCAGNQAEAMYKAGSYMGKGAGRNGDVMVEVKVSDSKIEEITVKEHMETEGISDPAIEDLPKMIVDKQSTEGVEAVSGATMTSNAILEAVNDALMQAKAK